MIEYKKEAFSAFQNLHQAIRSDTVEKLMKVQLVANQASQVAEQFRPEETDLSDLNYQGGEEGPMGLPGMGPTVGAVPRGEPASERGRMRMGPPRDMPDRPMNRADRRRMEKDNRKR